MVLSVGVSTCRLGDLINGPAQAILEVEPSFPDMLTDSAAVGSTAPRLNPLSIKNLGGGELSWVADTKDGSQWLSFQPESGKAGDPMHVVFHPDSLPPGTYSDTVVITTASGIAKTPVQFTIYECRWKQINYGDAPSDTLNSADCGSPHRSTGQHAQFYSFSGATGDTASIILRPQFNGFVALDTTPLTAAAPPLTTQTDCEGDATYQCIYYFILPNTSTNVYYIEVSSATTNDSGQYRLQLVHVGRFPNLPDSLDQRQPDSTHSILPGGATGASVLLRAVVSDSDIVDSLHLEAEVQRITDAFGNSANVPPGPRVGNGRPAWVRLSGLTDQTCYHWQVRVKDQTGRPSGWKPNGGNPDFCVQLGQNPNPPTNLVQLQSDGSTIIPVGGNANTTTVRFSAQVSDPDAGDQLHIEVEVQPTDTAFTNNPSQNQTFVASGNPGTTVTTIIAPTLVDVKNYHWHARTVDQTGRHSGWVSYPTPTPNLETATDFHVAVQNNNNLAFTGQPPAQVTAGIAMSPAVQVTAQDANGQTQNGFIGNVTMTIASGPPGGTFSPRSQTVVAAVAGVANFPNLILTKVGTYTLQASAVFSGTTVLSPASTPPTVVIAAPGKQLAFSAGPPASAQAGTAITPLTVSALDSLGNVATSFTGQVTLSITSGTGKTGAHLLGTTTVSASAGVAAFTTVNIDSTGTGYTLTAAATGLTSGASTAFNITPGPATHLAFVVPPSTTVANSPITPAVQVAARDAFENTATSFTGSVTIAIGTNPASGVLSSGTPNPANAVNGIAAFSSLSIDKIGNGYTLTASATGLTGATSGLFNIVNSNVSATNSSVTATSPITVCQTGCSTGAGTASLITVTVRDLGNAPVAGATVVLSAPGASFTQPGPTNASGVTTGTMTSTVAPQVVGVTAVANGVTISNPPSVTVNPGQPVSLTFTSQPGNTVAGATINGGSGVQVTAKDQFGNTAAFTGTVSMAIATGPGNTLTGTTGVNAVAGVAIFNNLSIRTPVGAYTLQASTASPALSTTSSSFNISAGAVARDTFIVQPQQTAVLARIDSGNAAGGVVVWITDAFGNLVTTATNSVTVALFDNPVGASLGGTKTRSASGGIITYNDLTVSKIGTGFTLIANITGFSSDVSTPFDIIPGPAKTLVFKTQPPASPVAGTAFGATVAALDAVGDTATSFAGNVTMSLNPSSGTLGGTTSVTASGGFAPFSNLTVAVAGGPYTLTAASPGVTSGTSNNFTVQPGGVDAGKSTVIASPTIDTACASTCLPATLTASLITVTARDANNNPITTGLPVTVTITGTGNNPASPVNGTTDGSGQFQVTLSSTLAEVKTISAVINSVSITQQATVTVVPASPAVLAFTRNPPASVTAGTIVSPNVQVTVRDQFGNRVTSATTPITLAFMQTGRGTLSGNSANASAGIATFTSLSATKATTTGSGQTQLLTPDSLVASATNLTPDTSSGFAVNPAAVSAAVSTVGAAPGTITASNGSSSSTITVTARDAFSNVIQGASVTLTANPTTGNTLTQPGATNVNGVATGTLSSTKAETKTVSATINGTGVTSGNPSVTVNPAAVSASASTIQAAPGTITASTGSSAATITVTAKDQFGNPIQGVTVVLAANPTTGNTLTQPASTTSSSGVATGTLSSTKAETKTVSATVNGTGITSGNASVDVIAATATQLSFTTDPTTTNHNATITPTIVVTAFDQFGNVATGYTGSITLSVTPGTPTSGGPGGLTGTNPVTALAGVATFTGMSMTDIGTGYTLDASDGSLKTTSSPFDIN